MISLEEAKTYLRVDSADEDTLILSLLETAEKLVKDVSRLSDEEFEREENRVRIAVLYATAYLFENREKANHKELTLTVRALLFGVREAKF